jgi:hypothetical protein
VEKTEDLKTEDVASFSNLPLIGIMSPDEKPDDHSFALNTECPVIAVHSGGPIRTDPFEMQ